MRREPVIGLILCFLHVGFGFAQDGSAKLSEEHRLWLDEQVVYIITEREREIFLLLETREERDGFIEAFWRKRDTTPVTPRNEFREEHQERLDYANRYFGRESPSSGWKTDRGRIYIKLGKPQNIERFPASGDLVPIELWFYSGDPGLGLPAHFYLIFFKQRSYGEYRLYHPAIDGPSSLLASSALMAADDPSAALEVLRRASTELSRAALSLDAGDAADFGRGRASPKSEILIASIEDSPTRRLSPDYADAWLRFRDKVSSEYSFNYVPHRSFFAILVAPDGTPFVNYTLEIDAMHFALEADEEQTKFYTTLDITTELRNGNGDSILAKDKSTYLELTPSQFQQVAALPFAYQDSYPVLPGDYKMTVVLRNRVLHKFTVAEFELHVEAFASDKPALTDIIPGFSTELIEKEAANRDPRTFQIGGLRVQPASDALFSIGEPVYAFFQVLGGSPDYEIQFSLRGEGRTIEQRSTKLASYRGGPAIERFVLENIAGGRYELGVRLVDPAGEVVARKTAQLNVTPRSGVPRPAYVMALGFNVASPGLVKQALGEQLLSLKRYDQARRMLEEAVAANSQLPVARWLLAETNNRLNDPERALQILEPMEIDHGSRYEVLFGLGYAYSLKNDCTRAVGYLERAISIRPPSATHLNLLSDCYQRLGNLQKAKEMLERSLELVPDQPAIKEQLEHLARTEPLSGSLTPPNSPAVPGIFSAPAEVETRGPSGRSVVE